MCSARDPLHIFIWESLGRMKNLELEVSRGLSFTCFDFNSHSESDARSQQALNSARSFGFAGILGLGFAIKGLSVQGLDFGGFGLPRF